MNTEAVHIPRLALKMIVFALLGWLGIIPAIVEVRIGNWQGALNAIALGVAMAMAIPALLFVHRLLLYVYWQIYWYIAGAIAFVALAFVLPYALMILSQPVMPIPTEIVQIMNRGHIPWPVVLGFVVGGLIALYILMRVNGTSPQPSMPQPATPPVGNQRIVPQAPSPQAQIVARAQRLSKP